MTVYRLEPAGPGHCATLDETLHRIASIVRKYATTRVAVRGHAVDVTLDPGVLHCDEPEAARRLATMTASWTGTRVEASPVATVPEPAAPEPAPAGPWTVRLAARGETPDDLRDRLARAATRLESMLAVHGNAPARWMLHLDRDGREAHMPLRPGAFEGGPAALARWLPDAALGGVTRVRLELRARRVAEPATRSEAVPARQGAA
ncbi:MAG: hypothetical protein U5Q44_15515 [Dehalococcoidia bacterium]|nr:hypothetical protein [Dehalococcoidia bacterium]